MKKSCAFTGHRPSGFAFGYEEADARCVDLKKRLFDTVTTLCYEGYRVFYTGMAEGADIWAAETVLRLSRYFHDIQLYAVIPFRGHREQISPAYRGRYDKILEYSSQEIVICDQYTPSCYKARNYFMAQECDALVAIYDEHQPRTAPARPCGVPEPLGKESFFSRLIPKPEAPPKRIRNQAETRFTFRICDSI